ncbi:MAG: hypothetical protein AB7I50_21960 [Vicinamibacterales bacterium]
MARSSLKLSSLISPGTWELVDRLRPYLDVCIDLFDSDLEPLLPESNQPLARLLRRLACEATEHRVATDVSVGNRFRTALQTATTQLFAVEDGVIGLYPLRHARIVVGILATAERATQTEGPLGERLERLGWSLRASIEADIETHARLTGEQQQTRWLATTLRFLEHLHACTDEAELIHALIQAAAIWGDLDARLYRRTPEGTFALHAALPSLVGGIAPRVITSAVLDVSRGPVRLSSVTELELLGWTGPHADVVFVPVGNAPVWLLAVGGALDDRLQRVLTVAAQTLALKADS